MQTLEELKQKFIIQAALSGLDIARLEYLIEKAYLEGMRAVKNE